MRRSLRRAVSLLCVLAMCLSLLPTTALAAGNSRRPDEWEQTVYLETAWNSDLDLSKVKYATIDGHSYKVYSDWDWGNVYYIKVGGSDPEGETVFVTYDGHTYSGENEYDFGLLGYGSRYFVELSKDSTPSGGQGGQGDEDGTHPAYFYLRYPGDDPGSQDVSLFTFVGTGSVSGLGSPEGSPTITPINESNQRYMTLPEDREETHEGGTTTNLSTGDKEYRRTVKWDPYPTITYMGNQYTYGEGDSPHYYTIEWYRYTKSSGYNIYSLDRTTNTTFIDDTPTWHVDGYIYFSDRYTVQYKVRFPGSDEFVDVNASGNEADEPYVQYVSTTDATFEDVTAPNADEEKELGGKTYTFSGWYIIVDGEEVDVTNATEINDDIIVYGKYVEEVPETTANEVYIKVYLDGEDVTETYETYLDDLTTTGTTTANGEIAVVDNNGGKAIKVPYSYTDIDAADVQFSVHSSYVLQGVDGTFVFGEKGWNKVAVKDGTWTVDNVDGDSTLSLYLNTAYSVKYYDADSQELNDDSWNDTNTYIEEEELAEAAEPNFGTTNESSSLEDRNEGSEGSWKNDDLKTAIDLADLPTAAAGTTVDGWFLGSATGAEYDPANYTEADLAVSTVAGSADDDNVIKFYATSITNSYALTINYVMDDENSTVIKDAYNGSISYGAYDYTNDTNKAPETITYDGQNYVYAGLGEGSDPLSGTATENVTITLVYSLDEWKDGDETDTPNDTDDETGGDDVPDYQQALIQYVVDGTGGSVFPAIQVETLDDTDSDGNYSRQVTATSTATADSGYAFDYWTKEGNDDWKGWTASLSDPFTAQGGQTYTYTAHFDTDANGDGIPDKYQVFVNFEAKANGSVSGTGIAQVFTFGNTTDGYQNSGTVDPDMTNVQANPETDYAFDYWTKDNEEAPVNPDTPIENVAGGTTIIFYANFAEDKIGEENPGEGDGTPDKYQATVTYKIVGGTWSDGNAEIFQVYTFQEFDEDTQTWTDVDPAPTLKDIPDTSKVTPDASHIKAGTWDNTPTAGSSLTAGETYTYTYTLTATAPAVSVTKIADKSTAKVGDDIAYAVTVTNNGNTDLTGVVVTDDKWAAGDTVSVKIGNASAADYTVAQDGTITIEALVQETSAVITYTYQATEVGQVTNNVEVTATGVTPDDDDKDTTTTAVTEADAPALDVEKALSQVNGEPYTSGPVELGDELTYTITVENTGNVALSGITVTDTMWGDEVTSITVGGSTVTVDAAGYIIDNLAVDNTVTITYTYTITAGDMGKRITNAVVAQTGDEDGPDDSDTTETEVEGELTVTIQPADITIYTGGEPYGGITDASGNIIEEASGLPEPGYHLELSDDVIDWLNEKINIEDEEDGPRILADYLTFTYDVDGVKRVWDLSYVGVYATDENGQPTRYVYSLEPGVTEDGEEIPVRLLFRDENGEVTDDDIIGMAENSVCEEYTMSINPGTLTQSEIKAVFTVPGEEPLTCAIDIQPGTLTIRSTTDEEYVNEIAADETGVDRNAITAVADDVTYYVNDSEVEVAADRVSLLVDEVSNDAGFNWEMAQDAMDHAIDSSATDWTYRSDLSYEMAYMDLVDTQNGHAVVTADDSMTIYWPMPDDADPDGDFHVVHYTGMDRENTMDESGLDNAAKEILTGDAVRIDGQWYVRFTTGSFSPFVLVYEEEDNDRPTRPDPDPDDDKDDEDEEPEEDVTGLNTTDHYAYIIGYEDGTVRPDGNITRAEVATIFFRLMTDEYRETYWSTSNSFTDVAAANWFNNAVSTTANVGWVQGYPDGSFQPNNYITRAEFATIAARFLSGDYTGGDRFTDITGHWAAEYINRAAAAGWINGYPDGTFRPNAYITRAEAVTLINRMLDRAPDANHLLADMVRWPDNPETAWYYADIQEATNSHDYTRAGTGNYEVWTELLANRDWAALEEIWSQANDAPGGEVADGLTPNGN